jgi:hypothetical protein
VVIFPGRETALVPTSIAGDERVRGATGYSQPAFLSIKTGCFQLLEDPSSLKLSVRNDSSTGKRVSLFTHKMIWT